MSAPASFPGDWIRWPVVVVPWTSLSWETAEGTTVIPLPYQPKKENAMPPVGTVEAEAWADSHFMALGIPINWHRFLEPCLYYQKIADNMRVVVSGSTERDGRRWLHVSLSRPSRLPSWDDVREVKDTFIGRDRKAIQVLPPAAEYVNDHPHCLHLWACIDDDGLPDFRKDGPRGKTI